jgi:hypothetical protein
MEQSTLLSDLKQMQAAHLEKLDHFRSLDDTTLTQRPENGGWTILECVAHLNLYASFYNKVFQQQVDSGKARTEQPYRPGYLGSRSAESMLPDAQGKLSMPMATMKKMNPKGKDLDRTIIDRLIDQQRVLLDLLEKMESIDLNRNRCALTIPVLKFRLGDTLRFHIYHNERHLQQAQRLLS